VNLRDQSLLIIAIVTWVSQLPAAAPQQQAVKPTGLMTPADLQRLPVRPPDHRLGYGYDSSQIGELRLPAGRGPHPVVTQGRRHRQLEYRIPPARAAGKRMARHLRRCRARNRPSSPTCTSTQPRFGQSRCAGPLGRRPSDDVGGNTSTALTQEPTELAQRHIDAAVKSGDRVPLIVVSDAGHFETASPRSAAWSVVRDAIRSLLKE
jgi:hypothetical protein